MLTWVLLHILLSQHCGVPVPRIHAQLQLLQLMGVLMEPLLHLLLMMLVARTQAQGQHAAQLVHSMRPLQLLLMVWGLHLPVV